MELTVLYQLLLATFLGALIGLEREIKKREAGLQTYALVSLGSCLFTISALYFLRSFEASEIDVARIIQAVAIGVGFIGAGTIFRGGKRVEGLTTAAGLWVVAGIGVMVAAGLYSLAAFATILALIVLAGFGKIEEEFFGENE
jgi:putative Mg2+ transporter-C (MgtC) family protein